MNGVASAAWQHALAAEHRAYFAYGLLGPRLTSADQRSAAYRDQLAHGSVRDAVEQAMSGARVTPVGPLADYPALYPVTDTAAARRLAVRVEQDCAAAWRYLFAVTGRSSLRSFAQVALTDAAVRAARWRQIDHPGRPTVAFPGV